MKCEEFEQLGWDAERESSLSVEQRAAAFAHAANCPLCGAMEESWRAARMDLRRLAASTAAAETPPRVEMRLRQEFRMRHRAIKVRRGGLILTWGLAAAALIFGTVTWINWRNAKNGSLLANASSSTVQVGNPSQSSAGTTTVSSEPGDASSETLIADANGDFTPLPGNTFLESDDASIVRVRMQRGALSAWGLPVNEERANEWIQVDLLVTDDGLPQGVRLSP